MSRDEASSGRIDGAPSTDAVDAGDAADGPDILEEATALITAANEAGVPVRLIGGLAVRYLTPSFPPRAHNRNHFHTHRYSPGSARGPVCNRAGPWAGAIAL